MRIPGQFDHRALIAGGTDTGLLELALKKAGYGKAAINVESL